MSDCCWWVAVDLGGMQGSLNKMAPASRQWRQAADWARELAHLVDTMQTWLARQLSSTSLPFQKVLYPAEGTCKALYCSLRLMVLSWVLRIFMENVHTKRILQTKQCQVVYCTLPRCMQLFLRQVWPVETVGCISFQQCSSQLPIRCCQQQQGHSQASQSASLTLARRVEASVLASTCW